MKKIYLFLTLSVLAITVYSQSTTLVISQVYGGGGNSGSVYTHDFIEIFNKSNSPVSLSGYSVQHTSAAGTSWNVTSLTSVTLQPGQYYLIQEAIGAGGTTPLPTPDATGTIAMGATSGKVALVSSTTALSGACPSGATIVDLVGYGSGASCFEGTIGPAPSNSNSISRKLNGCQDTQDNLSDFTAGAAAPRNTASAFNVCSATCTVPSQKPTGIRYGGSPSSTSMTVYFTRGNGTGSLVLCRQGAAVNTTPTSGVTYTANTVFGSPASNVNASGSYAVFSTTYKDVNAFTLTGLTAGTKYYFSVFEYNDPGKCYTSTGLVDSFTVNANLLHPGDMAFVGWDNDAVSGGEDKLYLTTMVDINKGTKFSLVNSRFESGAAANTRTNQWFSGGDNPYQDPYVYEFEYNNATPIAKGSVLSFESNGTSGFTNITVNGSAATSNFMMSGTPTNSNFMSTAGGDQVYIVQGKFTPYGTVSVDRYNLLNGIVIHGFTTGLPWVPLTSAVSAATSGAGRESRIPPQILCTAVEFNIAGNTYGAYLHSSGTTGTKSQLLAAIKNNANWSFGTGTAGVNNVPIAEPNINTAFTVSTPTAGDGQWLGNSTDWFDCLNWGGLAVPDTTTTTLINTTSTPFAPVINVATSANAAQYSNIARSNDLTIASASSLTLRGAGSDKLVLEGDLTINTGGLLDFEGNSNDLTDTLFVHKGITDNSTVPGLSTGLGTVSLSESRFSNIYAVNKTAPLSLSFYNLLVNNTRSMNIMNNVQVSNNLNLQAGYLNTNGTGGILTLANTATITSPANVYGQTNRGYFNSFVNGKMYYDADASSTSRIFPIGKYSTADTAYAPVVLVKSNTIPTTYDAEYFPVAYSSNATDLGQLHHVSSLEYWAINSLVTAADATVSLSWRPRSQVGDGVTAPAASLDKLVVAHYLDADGAGSNPSMWHIEGADVATMPKNGSATVNYGTVTTNLSNSIPDISSLYSSPYFTLGTRDATNILPLTLLDLSAVYRQPDVLIKWKVAQEHGLSHYIVEKSLDGQHFNYLSKVNSINSSNDYAYQALDLSPADGWNYYRLSIVEMSGKSNYSTIVKVWKGQNARIVIYPNPAHDEIKINLPVSSSISQIDIVNSEGQVVKQLATKEQSLTINIESLSKGVYFIRILNSRQAIAQKFTKQ